jgi:hypothetical protein
MLKLVPAVSDGVEWLNSSFHMHDEAIAATSTPSLTTGRYLSHELIGLFIW